MRGMLTDEVQDVAVKTLGRKITIRELRLMPYIQFELMNNQFIDVRKINQEERQILSNWRGDGWIVGGAGSRLGCTKEFWDALNDIMYVSYVNYERD